MALYKESHEIKVFEPNEITLNAVQGEGNEREFEFRLIEKSGDTLKTSNAKITNKMLDVTGCSVRLYVAKPDGRIVYMDGDILDGQGGVISFIPRQQVFTADGKASCILQITSAGGDLRAVGITLNIGKANIDGALESTDELSALTSALIELREAIRSGTEGTEVPLARGGETLLGLRLDKIESGERIASGAITLEKISAAAKAAFAKADHNHDSTYIKNTDGVITADLLSAAAKALFASANHTHSGYAKVNPAGVLDGSISAQPANLKNSVDAAAIQKNAVTGEKIADGSVTEQKVSEKFIDRYGQWPFAEITSYGDSADIPYDDYTGNGTYRFTGRYIPIVLFVIEGNTSYTTQLRIQGDEIQTRAYIANGWTEWGGGKAQLADSLEQFANQMKQLQSDAEKQVQTEKIADYAVTGKKLGYYSVSRDKIAPEAINGEKISSRAITPQKIADETKAIFANALFGYAEGDIARIADGIPDTLLQSAVVRGRSAVNEAAGTIKPLSPSVVVVSSNDGVLENHVNLPEGLQLYSTPNDQYYDTYDAITGALTHSCTVFSMSGGFIYGYSQETETVVWITDPLFRGNKLFYLVKDGTVTSSTTDWQGKIQIVISKTDAGITSTDTSAQAREKMLAYWGSAYAILPLKTPSVEQYEGVQLAIPAKECAVVCNNAYMDVTYCRDINSGYEELLRYTTDLQLRIAALESKG